MLVRRIGAGRLKKNDLVLVMQMVVRRRGTWWREGIDDLCTSL